MCTKFQHNPSLETLKSAKVCLENAVGHRIEGTELVITDANGAEILRFLAGEADGE